MTEPRLDETTGLGTTEPINSSVSLIHTTVTIQPRLHRSGHITAGSLAVPSRPGQPPTATPDPAIHARSTSRISITETSRNIQRTPSSIDVKRSDPVIERWYGVADLSRLFRHRRSWAIAATAGQIALTLRVRAPGALPGRSGSRRLQRLLVSLRTKVSDHRADHRGGEVQRLGHARQLHLVEPDLMLGGDQSFPPHSTGQPPPR